MKSDLHNKLQQDAIYWLYKNGCWIFGDEIEWDGRVYDAVGIKKNGTMYCVEVKATQQDLDKARQETIPYNRQFNFYYLFIPKELEIKDNFKEWGIIQEGEVKRKAKRFEHEKHFSLLTDLVWDLANRLCRERYFNNFRDEER